MNITKYVIKVAHAAPIIWNLGINTKFKETLIINPIPVTNKRYIVLFEKNGATLRFANKPEKKYDNNITGMMTSPIWNFSSKIL